MSIARQMMMAAAGGAQNTLTHSISFNGSSALYALNVSNTVWGNSAPYTYEAWINPAVSSGYKAIMGKTYSNPGGLFYRFGTALVFWQGGNRLTGGNMAADVWHHVVITRDVNGLNAYLNGVNVASSVFVGNVTAAEIFVGASRNNSGVPNTDFFNGLIARPRVSNIVRYAENFTPSTDYENDENSVFYVDVLDGVITELNGIPLSSVGSPGISTNTPT